jgi:hypothetical protein
MCWEQEKQRDGEGQSCQLLVRKLVTATGQNLLLETTLYVFIWGELVGKTAQKTDFQLIAYYIPRSIFCTMMFILLKSNIWSNFNKALL